MLSGLFLLRRNTTFHGIAKFFFLLLLSCNIAFTFKLAEREKKAAQLQKVSYTSIKNPLQNLKTCGKTCGGALLCYFVVYPLI